MSEVIISGLVGFVVAIVAVVVVQAWPSRFRWDKTIAVAEGEPSGRPIYRVRLGPPPRRLSKARERPLPKSGRVRVRNKRASGPIDVVIYARVAVGVGTGVENVAEIPVMKPWRPIIRGGVLTTLQPQKCEVDPLRHFSPEIRAKRADGTLSLHDLLSVERTQLRLYAFAYRPYLGTRLLMRAQYDIDDLGAGSYRRGRFLPAIDGKPPKRSDVLEEEAPQPGPRGSSPHDKF